MSTEGQLPTQSHRGGTIDLSRMNLEETLRSMQQSIERLVRDIEDLKKGKSSATIEQRVGDNFGGVNSPHHQRHYDNMSTQGYHDSPVHNPYPFHEVGYQGRPQARDGRRRGQEAIMVINKGIRLSIKSSGRCQASSGKVIQMYSLIGNDKWRIMVRNYSDIVKVKLFIAEFSGDALHWWERVVTQSVVSKPQALTYKCWPRKEDTPKVALKDNPKPKVEEKGREEKDDCQDDIVDNEESNEDQEIDSYEAIQEGLSLVTIKAVSPKGIITYNFDYD
ncbi:hypothetical protein M9H77_29945 [Catharanthus roseus]|uniref:Uncharacterized protein n=1 Tax=Catharanthus roseus TaxID=4058 RepID=A0ACB9ZY30_CATRO|nr:hypothetical protein M9H77_29945 [Catharanthus roseus]